MNTGGGLRDSVQTGIIAIALVVIVAVSVLPSAGEQDGSFTIARVQYDGGGDWYGDPSSLPNLLRFIGQHTRIAVKDPNLTTWLS